ncbi:unnamed protein product [Caenorhabditis angaria]|uniref:Domain of unknown function DB domain-containing protein n=1 Tax=Caenorhabditis angaria TaxID=860376 RepID=A0A9P1MYW5_9PELO|nr:unnamed protein product [Caenorhabditis angaria]
MMSMFVVQIDGCQGSSGGCCQRQPPPTVVQCGGQQGCQQGYGCGQYGCAKRKAFAGLTHRIDGVLVDNNQEEQAHLADASQALRAEQVHRQNISMERLMNPNFIFHSCCEARGLPDSCLKHCHFNTYNSDVLESMFHKTDECPIEAINEIHYCAAQGIDHSPCCATSGVSDTSAGDKCLAFCDQRPNQFTPIDISYLPCLDVFEDMKKCFFFEIKRRAQKKFGSKSMLSSASNGEGGFF